MLQRDVSRRVESLGDFLRQADTKPYRRTTSSGEWYGADYDQARQMCERGWSDVRPEADAIIGAVIGKVTQHVDLDRIPRVNMVGGVPNVPMMLAGSPTHMMSFRLDNAVVARPVVRLLVDAGAQADVSGRDMLRRAAALAAFIEIVQQVGHTVSVDLTSPIKDAGHKHNVVLTLHPAGGHFDLDSMMFCLGHPAFHRRLWFSHRSIDGVGGGMGTSVRIPDDLAADYDFVVRREQHRSRPEREPSSIQDPAGWVLWALRQIGLADDE